MSDLKRWRLILGKDSDPSRDIALDEKGRGMDDVLQALYDKKRGRGLGASSPTAHRWLNDIRSYFPGRVVSVLQKDAYERLGVEELLFEPELLSSLEADVHLVATLISLQDVIPEKTHDTARQVVRQVVRQLMNKLKPPFQHKLSQSLRKRERNRHPDPGEIDLGETIRRNLKHYQKDLQAIIPRTFYGYRRRGRSMKDVFILVDQSGSMTDSVVYASIYGAVLGSTPSLNTRLYAFDSRVHDLSDQVGDPVELLFGIQAGGGTDICRALQFAEEQIERPQDSILVLISDLEAGRSKGGVVRVVERLKKSGVRMITLPALSDEGQPAYNRSLAGRIRQCDIPVFACTPDVFPDLMSDAIEGKKLREEDYQ